VFTGGLFLGTRSVNVIEITGLTTPFPQDRATLTSFTLKDPLHQSIVDSQWRLSGGVINYIGDWHTHPEKDPTPSYIDKEYWKRLTPPNLPMIYGIQGQRTIKKSAASDRVLKQTQLLGVLFFTIQLD
jgi:integrative and conjugative element protein (TIGR02256 family)